MCVLGDQYLSDRVYGDVAFVPDPEGTHARGSERFSKPYFTDHTGRRQSARPARIASVEGEFVDLPGVFFDGDDIVSVLTPEDMRSRTLRSRHAESLESLEQFALSLVPEPARDLEFGLIGSVGLGFELLEGTEPHDWDIVLTCDSVTRRVLVESLQTRALNSEDVRVSEYGKGWLIRQWVDGKLFCPFFRDATFSPFAFSDLRAEIEEFHGVIADPWDSVLVPARVGLRTMDGEMYFVIIGLRSRGDFRTGSSVTALGRRCRVVAGSDRVSAVVVVEELNPIRVEAPWPDYYA